jgi:hypothetical protein
VFLFGLGSGERSPASCFVLVRSCVTPWRFGLARYRLRFLLQEIDLPRGTTLLGRSPECHVTLEDPLVSRQHARIVIGDEGAVCEDLKSRNGVKVNGLALKGPTKLRDGDRVRIGTHELVFCEVAHDLPASPAKTTGFLLHCARCRLPYPQEVVSCPNCGATEQLEEDTMTGQLQSESRRSWGVQLLAEVAQKALSLDRTQDAVRALHRIMTQLEDRVLAHEPLDQEQLDHVALLCVKATVVSSDPVLLGALLRIYARSTLLPSLEALDAMRSLPAELRAPLVPGVEAVTSAFSSNEARTKTSPSALARLQDLADDIGAMGPADETRPNPVMPS